MNATLRARPLEQLTYTILQMKKCLCMPQPYPILPPFSQNPLLTTYVCLIISSSVAYIAYAGLPAQSSAYLLGQLPNHIFLEKPMTLHCAGYHWIRYMYRTPPASFGQNWFMEVTRCIYTPRRVSLEASVEVQA